MNRSLPLLVAALLALAPRPASPQQDFSDVVIRTVPVAPSVTAVYNSLTAAP